MRDYTTQCRLIVMMLVYTGCTQDPCVQLCEETTTAIDECLDSWPATWSDIGTSSRQNFLDSCRNQWAAERSILEPRALDDAYEQCEEATTYLSNNTQRCDHMRAIYLIPEDY